MAVLAWFMVDGRARTKGSLKVYCTKGPGHKVRVEEEVEESKRWRRKVAVAAQANQRGAWGQARLGHPGPVEVRLVVWFARQLSRDQRRSHGGQVIPSHQTPYPTDILLGDGDKLARNIGDALVDAGLILDDSQITDWMIAKRWLPEEEAEPRVDILVQESDPSLGTRPPGWAPEELSFNGQEALV